MAKNKSISLVLGSGGARGLAHIGVLRWLDEHDYKIETISGSSMGALIGGIYAAGKLETYTKWVSALDKSDVFSLLDFAYSRSGLFSGDRLMGKLKELLGDIDIEDLPLSFTAVACDLEARKEVWLKEGSLFDAIRASISIPTIFTPIKYKGRLLVDGGLLNPIPIAPTMSDLTDMTIAVDLSAKSEDNIFKGTISENHDEPDNHYISTIKDYIDTIREKFHSSEKKEKQIDAFRILMLSVESMQNSISRFKLASYHPDYIVDIPENACAIFDFHRAREMIQLGYERAEKSLGHLDKTGN
ncbi:MAG: patatin-like phospholipase family protein [Thioalkalispiraceae bacterium]|jgi:NTE family protein